MVVFLPVPHWFCIPGMLRGRWFNVTCPMACCSIHLVKQLPFHELQRILIQPQSSSGSQMTCKAYTMLKFLINIYLRKGFQYLCHFSAGTPDILQNGSVAVPPPLPLHRHQGFILRSKAFSPLTECFQNFSVLVQLRPVSVTSGITMQSVHGMIGQHKSQSFSEKVSLRLKTEANWKPWPSTTQGMK